jgi:hypothetical protein
LSVVAAVTVRPILWPTAVVQLFRLARRGWWRKPPFLPLPTREYLDMRLVTQYGGTAEEARSRVEAIDVVEYLRWCRRWNRTR